MSMSKNNTDTFKHERFDRKKRNAKEKKKLVRQKQTGIVRQSARNTTPSHLAHVKPFISE